MAFGQKEASRDRSTPTRLFLFRGADPALESLLKSVVMLPGATEFGYGTTRVTQIATQEITDWNVVPLEDGAIYNAGTSAANSPAPGTALVGRTQQITSTTLRVTASDPLAQSSWQRNWSTGGGWGAWNSIAYKPIASPDDVENGVPLNYYAGDTGSDFQRSLDDLIAAAPDIRNVTLTVAWHGNDLRAGECTVRPKVASAGVASAPYQWRVGAIYRSDAQLVSQFNDAPAYDGAPSDRSLFEAIQEIRSRGLRCTIYPTLLMDIPPGNSLPDPAGSSEQPSYPWRGRIAVHPGSVEGTADARSQINAFFGTVVASDFSWNSGTSSVNWSGDAATDWRYRKFVLHMATIAAAAGANDFLIGGDLVGLTRIRDENGAFPAVDRLVALANDCRSILGATPRISYAAHWTEFHSVQEGENVIFHLDKLWAAANIDFVGIDNFAPISDWREGAQHLDWQAGYTSLHDIPYLQSNIEGGEGYDWRYANMTARNNQARAEIDDTAYDEPWIRRPKDFRGWWANAHHNRIGGIRQPTSTAWTAKSKPIVLTAIGCAAVNKGSNRPDVAADYKSSESATPYYSNGRPDVAIMRAFLEAHIRYWQQNNEPGFIETNSISAYAWDARPYPTFPERTVFQDRANWRADHHLTGRLAPGRAFSDGEFGPFAFTDAEFPITRAGITYQPWPIKHDDINSTSSLDKTELNVSLAMGSGIEDAFIGFPPSQVINLTIFQGQVDDTPTLADYPAIWLGRVNAPQWQDNEITFACLPVSSSIRRPGLRRNYQIGCPHVLYGPKCKADRKAASRAVAVDTLSRNVVTLTGALPNHQNYRGGLAEWTTSLGSREVRTIIGTTSTTIILRGSLKGLETGMQITVRFGCDHTLGPRGCALHANFYNYGGQDMIPLDNPLSQKNQFY